MPSAYRKFGGQWYKLRTSKHTKREAKKSATSLRKKGAFLARSVKTSEQKKGHAVYYRGASDSIKYPNYLPAPGYIPPEAEEVRRQQREVKLRRSKEKRRRRK